jgi:hypothetical protein
MTPGELRSARLVFAGELALGGLSEGDLEQPAIRRAVAAAQTLGRAIRTAETVG